MKKVTAAEATVRAARISRRSVLKSAIAFGAAGVLAPLYSKSALSASGELNFMGWAGYPDFAAKVFPAFTKATGIKVNFKELDSQDNMLAEAKLAGGAGGIDMVEPTVERTSAWVSNGLIQPWDLTKISMDAYLPGLADGAAGEMAQVEGKRYHVPSVWGTEAMVFSRKDANTEYGKASLGDLWNDANAGKVTMRPHSSLAAMGRYLDSIGKLPKPFMEGYKDEASMKMLWDIVLAEAIKHKKNVVQFWSGENEAQAAFKANGATLGLCWDSTGYNLRNDGFGFIAPKEGAFAWNQGVVLMKGAKNVEQAHALAKWIASPEGAGMWATAFSANPVGKGGIEKMDPEVTKFYNSSYPGDALKKLWWWPAQAAWFLKLRGEYADKWKAA